MIPDEFIYSGTFNAIAACIGACAFLDQRSNDLMRSFHGTMCAINSSYVIAYRVSKSQKLTESK